MDFYNEGLTEENIKFGFGVRTSKADCHWLDASENFSFLDKKTILILPGSGTNSAKAANGMCKIAEKMLSEDAKDSWQICSMYYGNSQIRNYPTVVRAQRMFDKYFVPLIANKDENDDLHRLPAEQAMHNMRNLVVFTHCYGGYIMDAIEQQLKQTMQNLGYSAEEQKLIQKQLFVIQHNNIQDDIEKHPTATTQLIRISQQDNERIAEDMKYGTFSHYMQTYSIPENDVSYLKFSENQRALFANRITQKGVDEHNGGYWQDRASKTLAGVTEEKAFKIIFDEVVSSGYPIENMEQIIRSALEKNPESKEEIHSVLVAGKSMMDGYDEYSTKSNGVFNDLYNKLNTNQLSKADIWANDVNCCFVQDDNNKFLIDYLLERKQYDLAIIMFQKMSKNAKIDKYDHCLNFGNDCSNKIAAARKTTQWAQIAINNDQPELLAEIAKVEPNLWRCDYNEASINVLKIAATNVFTENNLPNASLDQWKFMQNLITAYKRNENLPVSDNTLAIRGNIEKFLFTEPKDKSKKIYEKKKFIEECEKAGIPRLVNLAKSSWEKSISASLSNRDRVMR